MNFDIETAKKILISGSPIYEPTLERYKELEKERIRRERLWIPEVWEQFAKHGYSKERLLDLNNIERVEEYPIQGMSGNGIVYYLDGTPLFMVFYHRIGWGFGSSMQVVIKDIKKEDYDPEPTKIPMKPLEMAVDLDKVDISKEMEMLYGKKGENK